MWRYLGLLPVSLILWSSPAWAASWKKAAPIEVGDLRIQLEDVDMDDEDLELEIKVYNRGSARVVITTNKMRIVPSIGQPLTAKNRKSLVVKRHNDKEFDLDFEAPNFDWEDTPGAWLFLEGITIDGQPASLPPMKLGAPKHQPGPGAAPAAPPSASSQGRVELAPAPSASGAGLQEFTGVRAKIQAPGTKVAAMPLRISEVPKQMAFIMDELLLTELQAVGFEAIGPEDVKALVGFETMRDETGCDDASCVAEIGNALGVPFLVAGSVAKLDNSVVITLKLINVRETRVQARVSTIADGSARILPRVIGEVVQDMIRRAKL